MTGEEQIQQRLLKGFGIRVDVEMSRYVLRQIEQARSPKKVSVIGGDARTGSPMRLEINLADLQRPAT